MTLIIIVILLLLFISSLYLSSVFEKRYNWIFSIFHFLSGFLLAFLLSQYLENKMMIVIAVFFIGMLWEGYEYLIDKIKFLKETYRKYFKICDTTLILKDTIFDLILDVLGAIFFILLFQS